MTATVSQTADGRFTASANVIDSQGNVDSVPVRTDLATIEEAQRVADKLAHPQCDESCAPWPATPKG